MMQWIYDQSNGCKLRFYHYYLERTIMSLQYASGNIVLPIFDENSRILILGSFPDVKARDVIGFCYSNPRNRFWDVMTSVFGESFPKPDINHPENKDILIAKLRKHHIALWNVICECKINGALDNTIRNAKPNDINIILQVSKIEKIFTNGSLATTKYNTLLKPITGIEATRLPSTSPRNTKYTLNKLVDAWKIIGKIQEP